MQQGQLYSRHACCLALPKWNKWKELQGLDRQRMLTMTTQRYAARALQIVIEL